MSREQVRRHKRGIALANRPDADGAHSLQAQADALALLDRSIGFGHIRLAVIRLVTAARLAAPLTAAHWAYCAHAVQRSREPGLAALLDTVVPLRAPERDTATRLPPIIDSGPFP